MKQHRVFIAINLPEDVKNELEHYQKQFPELPVRWTASRNLHATLVFIGYVKGETLAEICAICKDVAARHQPFAVSFKNISYGPPKVLPPRLIWLQGEESAEFVDLKEDVEETLLSSSHIHFAPEKRSFAPHITLGRIQQWEWRKVDPEERPDIAREVDFNFSVDSIEVMESELRRGGAEYTIAQSFPLGS